MRDDHGGRRRRVVVAIEVVDVSRALFPSKGLSR